LLLLLVGAPAARAQDDAMAPYRTRFKSGMDRYKAGDLAGALAWWEPIYREVGAEKGYRVAFDLARAYDKLQDATRAAERYTTFLTGVDARRARGETIEPIVQTEESDARARLAALDAEKGRIGVDASGAPTSVQVDGLEPRLAPFVTYVAPGTHTVTFAPGTREATKRDVDVAAGAIVHIAPPIMGGGAGAPATPAPLVVAPTPPPVPVAPPPATRAAPAVTETEHPFSPVLLYVSGAATVGAIVLTSVEYARALSAKSDFRAASTTPLSNQLTLRESYDSVRPLAYAGLGVSIGLAAVTAGLTSWYALGAKERVTVTPVIAPTPGGATAALVARY
jgi:hypothetical protein